MIQTDSVLKEYRTKNDAFWKRVGEEAMIALFHDMAQRIPAYGDFLKKHHIDHKKIVTIQDIAHVPPTDKPTYIDAYPLHSLCWGGNLQTSYMMSASSGSTGNPHYWPRSEEQTEIGAMISECIYREYFEMEKKSTLYIIGFAMGTWIAGTYMMMSTLRVAQKNYPVTVVTPGTNKEEIFHLIQLGAKEYDQIVLVGYPPFMKDIVDSGIERGIKWKNIPVRFLFSGEAFTETWRDYMQKKSHFSDILTDAINIYGSADVGLVAHETPVSIYVRRLAAKNSAVLSALFHSERVPSVNQYDPRLRYFETIDTELHVSTRSGLPLIRYNTKDIGDIMYLGDVKKRIFKLGYSLDKDFTKERKEKLLWTTPLVYLFGRGKFTVVIYGSNIYPEHMKLVVEQKQLVEQLTGKFVLTTENDVHQNPILIIHIELKEGKNASEKLSQRIKKVFLSIVPKINSEYRNNLTVLREKVHPRIILHSYGDPAFFPRGIVKKLA